MVACGKIGFHFIGLLVCWGFMMTSVWVSRFDFDMIMLKNAESSRETLKKSIGLLSDRADPKMRNCLNLDPRVSCIFCHDYCIEPRIMLVSPSRMSERYKMP